MYRKGGESGRGWEYPCCSALRKRRCASCYRVPRTNFQNDKQIICTLCMTSRTLRCSEALRPSDGRGPSHIHGRGCAELYRHRAQAMQEVSRQNRVQYVVELLQKELSPRWR